jgi:hypothetical protein
LQDVETFERRQGITLPDEYRTYLTQIANGGQGPPVYGILCLGKCPTDMSGTEKQIWTQLPYIRLPFPFTKPWCREDDEISDEGTPDQVAYGSLCLGTSGCGQNWHLIITGPDRGKIWLFTGEGIMPTYKTFSAWYDDWLAGKDPLSP